jgi:hypothetical protein
MATKYHKTLMVCKYTRNNINKLFYTINNS